MNTRKLTENDLREENLPLECWFGESKRVIRKDMRAYIEDCCMTDNVDNMLGYYTVEVKEHNFAWAIEQLKDGKKVRDKTWTTGTFVVLDEYSQVMDEDGDASEIYYDCLEDLENRDHDKWELYEGKLKHEEVEFFQIIGDVNFYSKCGLYICDCNRLGKIEIDLSIVFKTGISIKLEINRAELKVIKEVE